MYPLGHIGITLLISNLLVRKYKLNWNARFIVLASILPDILDKPLGLIGIGGGRFFFHSILFIVFLFFIRKELFFGSTVHLILDRMWEEPKVLFYPILGFYIGGKVFPVDFIQFFLENPYSQIGEIVGLISLVMVKSLDHLEQILLKVKIRYL
ncbi:hypothetical protein DRP04_07610 [Archaeoglobales archaeon]|nr:MAG: hypothetical protein DRP04_07610 [Archaeoglobales archaeon]